MLLAEFLAEYETSVNFGLPMSDRVVTTGTPPHRVIALQGNEAGCTPRHRYTGQSGCTPGSRPHSGIITPAHHHIITSSHHHIITSSHHHRVITLQGIEALERGRVQPPSITHWLQWPPPNEFV